MPAILLLTSLAKQMEADLDWRHGELATFRELLTIYTKTETRKRALFRAGWLLLYAHYEGFSKFSLELYVEFISKVLADCNTLPDRIFVYSIEDEIKKARSLPSEEIFSFFRNDVNILRSGKIRSIEIDTRSNLWPDLFAKILARLDLDGHMVIEDERKLKTLVARRNDIAHGKKVFIDEMAYYSEYENAVSNTMYTLALAIISRAQLFAQPAPVNP